MFDAGECIVVATDPSNNEAINETMAKGDTSDAYSWTVSGYSVSVSAAVDADGVVTLTLDPLSSGYEPSSGDFGGWHLQVWPQYDVSALMTRAKDISAFYAAAASPQGFAESANESGGGGG
jgi:hypothetical protein